MPKSMLELEYLFSKFDLFNEVVNYLQRMSYIPVIER